MRFKGTTAVGSRDRAEMFDHSQRIAVDQIKLKSDLIHEATHEVQPQSSNLAVSEVAVQAGQFDQVRLKGLAAVAEHHPDLITSDRARDADFAIGTAAIGMLHDVRACFVGCQLARKRDVLRYSRAFAGLRHEVYHARKIIQRARDDQFSNLHRQSQ